MKKSYLLATVCGLSIVLSGLSTKVYALNLPTLPNPFAKKAQVTAPASAPAIAPQQPTAAGVQAAPQPAATPPVAAPQPAAAPSKPAEAQLSPQEIYALEKKKESMRTAVYNAILDKCSYIRGMFLYKSDPEKVAQLKKYADEADLILNFDSPEVLEALKNLNITISDIHSYINGAEELGKALDTEIEARLDREATNQFGASSMEYDRLGKKSGDAADHAEAIAKRYTILTAKEEARAGIDNEIKRRRKAREDAAAAKAAAEQAERQKNMHRSIQFDPETGRIARRADNSTIYVDDPDNPFKGK